MGSAYNSIDVKNRVNIPAKFRSELGMRCIITTGLDSCLVVYPMDTWYRETENYTKLPRGDEEARAFIRFVYGNAEEVEIDKQGRILIPQILKEKAGLEKDLVTFGSVDRLEIWAKEVYDNDPRGGLSKASDFKDIGQKYQV